MWTRHITNPETIQHSTDELVAVLATEPDTVVTLMRTGASDIVIKQTADGEATTIMFLSKNNHAVAVTMPITPAQLEAMLAAASFAYHQEQTDG